MNEQDFGPGDFTERTLTFKNYAADYDEDGTEKSSIVTRITVAPGMVQAVIASEDPVQTCRDLHQHKVNILLIDNNQIEVYVTAVDLSTLERAVGAYFLPEHS